MLIRGVIFRSLTWVFLSIILTACADNSAYFESGLKDPSLGKPVMEGENPAGSVPAVSSETSLDSYKLSNIMPSERPAMETDEGGLWLSIESEEMRIRNAGNRITDVQLNSYIDDTVRRITGDYYPGIRVYLQRVPTFNAFMSPNGMMVVWSGLLLRARNEAEMVAVLGHEFGHYLRRHSLGGQRDMIAKRNVLAFAAIAMAAIGAPAGTVDLMAVGTQASISSFSRDHEREADGYGLRILFDGGYDLHASPAMWERLLKEEEKGGKERTFNPIIATHPAILERLSEQKRIADALTPKLAKQDLGRERYLENILPHRAAFIEDEISTKPQKQSLALLDILIEDGVRLGELYFYKGEVYRRSAAKDGPEEALKLYEMALQKEGFPPEVYKSRALARLALGQNEPARQDLEMYLQKMPQAPDALLIRMQIEELK